MVYDPATGRWYASALAEAIPPGSVGPADSPNEILLAVSMTSDPTQGWIGFAFQTDPTGVTAAEFDSLGFNANSVVVTANMNNIATGVQVANAILSVPEADLTGASATVARASFETIPLTGPNPETSYDPILDYDSTANEVLLSESSSGPVFETVSGGGGPTITVTGPSTLINGLGPTHPVITTTPVAAPQPAGAPPLTTGPGVAFNGLDTIDSRFSGTIDQFNGDLWAAQTVGVPNGVNPATQDEVQWFEIDIATDTIINHGVISETGLSFYDPSVSVDSAGDVAIGFSGSSLTQQISSYAEYWARAPAASPARFCSSRERAFTPGSPTPRPPPPRSLPSPPRFSPRAAPIRSRSRSHPPPAPAARSSTWDSPARHWSTATTRLSRICKAIRPLPTPSPPRSARRSSCLSRRDRSAARSS